MIIEGGTPLHDAHSIPNGVETSAQTQQKGLSFTTIEPTKDRVTTSGRPVLENGAFKDSHVRRRLQAQGIAFVFAPAPYRDLRAKVRETHLMNQSAYELILPEKEREQLYDGLAWVHDNFFTNGQPETYSREMLEELLTIPRVLSSYLMYRVDKPLAPQQQAEVVGNITKAALGIHMAVKNMKETDIATLSPRSLYAYANAHALLISSKEINGVQQVCAASPGVIVRSLEALLEGKGGQSSQSDLQMLVPNFAELRAYALAGVQRWQAVNGYRNLQFLTNRRLLEIMPQEKAAIRDAAETHSIERYKFVDRLSAAQDAMNIALGRDPQTAPKVTRADLDAQRGPITLRKLLQNNPLHLSAYLTVMDEMYGMHHNR